jgi:hypothetical protein
MQVRRCVKTEGVHPTITRLYKKPVALCEPVGAQLLCAWTLGLWLRVGRVQGSLVVVV